MKGHLLHQFTVGILVLAPVFGSFSASAEDLREVTCAGAQEVFPDSNPGPGSLKALRPHRIPELASYVRDRRAAIPLGKAPFWDMQVGSDGIQACGSSQGVKLSRFVRAVPGADRDVTVPVPDEVFNINGINTRRAEPRTPTVINAAFNRDAFWDGRAETSVARFG